VAAAVAVSARARRALNVLMRFSLEWGACY
jgi:hypothetical protein